MEDIKYSTLLRALLQEAKKIGANETNPLTIERFLVVLIDEVLAKNENDPDILMAEDLLGKVFGDLEAAREGLMAYLNQENDLAFLDEMFMEKRIMKAWNSAQELQQENLGLMDLLLCVINDPSRTVQQLRTDVEPGEGLLEPMQEVMDQPGIVFDDLLEELIDLTDLDQDQEPQEEEAPVNPKYKVAWLVEESKKIRTALQEAVYGQDQAINVFTTGYFQSRMRDLMDPTRRQPCATFLFAGPPGVGKTYLAETAAAALGLPFARFDMSEYVDKEANIEFCGSDKVYRNGKAGNVTSFVEENPKCVLLFDEIEKAHISVIHLFLQILDAGRLRDNYTDREVSFRDAIVILTTNAGKQLYEETANLSAVSRKVVIRALERDMKPGTDIPFFPAAICSRFASGNVVMFNHVAAHNLRTIAKREICRRAEALGNAMALRVEIDEPVYTALLFSEGSNADARTIRGRAESFLNDELYELLRLMSDSSRIVKLEKLQVRVDLERAKPEIRNLFRMEEKPKVLVLASEEAVKSCAEKTDVCQLVGVQTAETAVEAVKKGDIRFALLDMHYGVELGIGKSLNIEDMASPARDFYKFLREQSSSLPVYLLEDRRNLLSDEERISLLGQGIRGSLHIGSKKLAADLAQIAEILYQQAVMDRLSRENKLLTFESAQKVSGNGKSAEIRLFDFDLKVAVDSEDARNVCSAVSMPQVRFDEVIGAEDAKKELRYFVEYLKNPQKYMGTGVKPPKGVLLYGPPGTGKTMLAKAMACEAGVTFLAAEGNQFLKPVVGEGSDQVHNLFRTARKYAPAILFVDEIDAIAKERRGNSGSEETLTAFLTEMDGFSNDPTKPVFVLAATNFEVESGSSRSLDPALMRRFDRRVYIDLPGKDDRIRFMKLLMEKNPALQISQAQIENIALRATGMSLAELDSVFELALRSAIRADSPKVTDSILEEAFETFNGGEVKKWDASLLERVARHEAGHALLYWLAGQTPAYLTVVARGSHGGYMQQAEQEGKALFTKAELLDLIRTALGGRAAELVCYGERDGISTGAGGDLAAATKRARQLVCGYGMDEQFGMAVVEPEIAAGGVMAPEVRAAVNRILQQQLAEAVTLITQNREKLDALVDALMTKNHLNRREIEQVLK